MKRFVCMSAAVLSVLVLAAQASARESLVTFEAFSGLKAVGGQRNIVLVGPAGSQTFFDIVETNASSSNLIVSLPDLYGNTSPFLFSGAGGECALDPANPTPGLLQSGEACIVFFEMTMPQNHGASYALLAFPVYDESGRLLGTFAERVTLVST